jgi:hypothetical protein
MASITPTVTLDQSGGTQAGTTKPLGMDLKFAPTTGDSPKNMTLSLPPGLLASASVGGGSCLHSTTAQSKCQVGTGTVTATTAGLLPLSVPLTFYLVAPPKKSDLAGLVVMANVLGSQSQLGSPGEVVIRASSDPRGVGLNIVFTNLPDTFSGLPVSVSELKSTFSALRLPTSCPATPATVHVSANSYSASAMRSADAPLHVTGCSTMPFTAGFHVQAKRDSGDQGVALTTEITQAANPPQATAGTVRLALPIQTVQPNLGATSILCADPASGTCKTIGSATAVSPLYPTPLVGKAYLTGKLGPSGLPNAVGIAIVFPPPFALAIQGSVDLATNTTTFHNVPDIPQTDLKVALFGGRHAAFISTCKSPTGTASSTLTSQDGNRTVKVSSRFTVGGCHKSKPPKHRHPRPRIITASMSGLASGRPALKVSVASLKGAPKIKAMLLTGPKGTAFLPGSTISAIGGTLKSGLIAAGSLLVTLAKPVPTLTLIVPAGGIGETSAFRAKAKHHRLGKLRLTITFKDSHGKRSTATHLVKVGS